MPSPVSLTKPVLGGFDGTPGRAMFIFVFAPRRALNCVLGHSTNLLRRTPSTRPSRSPGCTGDFYIFGRARCTGVVTGGAGIREWRDVSSLRPRSLFNVTGSLCITAGFGTRYCGLRSGLRRFLSWIRRRLSFCSLAVSSLGSARMAGRRRGRDREPQTVLPWCVRG